MARRFDQKVVWITGGGSGIGRALAGEFAAQGARVAISGRRAERLEEVAAELRARGAEALAAPCDVTDEESVAGAVAAITERFGQLDVAVANAGFSVNGPVESLSLDDWRRQFEVNVIGAIGTAKYALPELRRTRGRLALVGSVMSMLVIPGAVPYAASKFALRAVGLGLAQELHGTGVSVTNIYPGVVESEIAQVDNRGRLHADKPDNRPAQLMWSAEDAARVIVPAIWRRKREFVFTTHGKIGAVFGQHAPSLVHLVMTRAGIKRPYKAPE